MAMIAVSVVVGLGDFNLWIFGGDIAFIGIALALEPRVRRLIANRRGRGILAFESPLNWLLGSIRFFLVSIFASVAYGIMNAETLVSIGGFDTIWFFIGAVMFLASGVMYVARTSEWIFNPQSRFNLRLGQALALLGRKGGNVLFFGMLTVFQILPSLLEIEIIRIEFIDRSFFSFSQFGLLVACIVSNYGYFATSFTSLSNPTAPATRKNSIDLLIYFAPWLYLILFAIAEFLYLHLMSL